MGRAKRANVWRSLRPRPPLASARPAPRTERRRTAASALSRARPQVCDDGLGHPARTGLVFQIRRVEFGVQRLDRSVALDVGIEQARPLRPVRSPDRDLRPSVALAPHRLELRPGWIPGRQLPPHVAEHTESPGPQMPREVGVRPGTALQDAGRQLHRIPVLVSQPPDSGRRRRSRIPGASPPAGSPRRPRTDRARGARGRRMRPGSRSGTAPAPPRSGVPNGGSLRRFLSASCVPHRP